MLQTLLHIQLLATLGMTGLIWFVQLVHYPLMQRVDPDAFVAYETAHQRRTTWIVAPLMLAEGIAAIGLLIAAAPHVSIALLVVNLGTVLLLWASTALVQMPLHARLARGYDAAIIRRLVATNWLRTTLWTLRTALVLALLAALK
jgi:hypothetical protein